MFFSCGYKYPIISREEIGCQKANILRSNQPQLDDALAAIGESRVHFHGVAIAGLGLGNIRSIVFNKVYLILGQFRG